MKTYRAYILLLLLLFGLTGCTEAAVPREPREIIREMVLSFGRDQDTQKAADALEELQKSDPAQAEQWQHIMSFWEYANQEMPLHAGQVSGDLPEDNSLCIVTLGFQLNSDGSMQAELVGRLETTLAAARAYPKAKVLCAGGGTASGNRAVTEAGQMAYWLMEHGIASERILLEDTSMTTTQNAQYSSRLLHTYHPEITTVLLVSSDYHIPWGAVLFETAFTLEAAPQHITVAAASAWETFSSPAYAIGGIQANGILELAQMS